MSIDNTNSFNDNIEVNDIIFGSKVSEQQLKDINDILIDKLGVILTVFGSCEACPYRKNVHTEECGGVANRICKLRNEDNRELFFATTPKSISEEDADNIMKHIDMIKIHG